MKVKFFTACVLLVSGLLLSSCKTQQQAGAHLSLGSVHDLSIDESHGGHTLQRHVGRTDEQLKERLTAEPNISAASTYSDRKTAEHAIGAAIDRNSERIRRWIERGNRRPNLVLDYDQANEPLGRIMFRGSMGSVPCDHSIIVLKAEGAAYFVLTSYPECRP